MVLEEGDGPNVTEDDNSESADTRDESPLQPVSTSRSSIPQTPSTEDLSAKKRPGRVSGSGLRTPAAGKSKFVL